MFRYLIESDRVIGRPDLVFAIDQVSKEKVMLEFYETSEHFEESKDLNLKLQHCDYVCR